MELTRNGYSGWWSTTSESLLLVLTQGKGNILSVGCYKINTLLLALVSLSI